MRLIDAGALVESPLGDGRGSALVAGRYGYPGPIVGAITPTVQLGYWDYQARATWRVGDRDTLGVFAFGSHDYLGTASTSNGKTGPDRRAARLRLSPGRPALRPARSSTATCGSRRPSATTRKEGPGGGDGAAVDHASPTSRPPLRLEVDKKLSPTVRVRGGADVRVDDYGFAQGQAPTDRTGRPSRRSPAERGTRLPPTSPGARTPTSSGASRLASRSCRGFASTCSSRRARPARPAPRRPRRCPAFDPRLSARVTVAPGRRLALELRPLAPVSRPARRRGPGACSFPSPGSRVGDSQLQTVAQASQGVEVALPADFTLTTTGFLSGWSGLTDLTTNCIQIMPATTLPQNGNAPPSQVSVHVSEQPARPRPRVRRRGAPAEAVLEAAERLAVLHAVAIDARRALPHADAGATRRPPSPATTTAPTS